MSVSSRLAPPGTDAPATRVVRRRRRVAVRLGLLLVLALAGWTALESFLAVDGARETQSAAAAMQRSLSTGDWPAALAQGRHLDAGAERFAAALGSPPLRLAGLAPVYGRDVRAARELSLGLREASHGAQPLVRSAAGLDPAALMSGGRVDVERLRSLAPAAAAADHALSGARERIDRVPADTLHAPLRSQALALQRQVDRLQSRVATAASAAENLPAMLGADGPRTYLLAFQNLAEARPTGGIFGSYGLLQADDGRLKLVDSGVNNDLGQVPPSALVVDPQVEKLYGADVTVSQNFNLSPDFPQAAKLLVQLWTAKGRPPPDAVLAVDPVALAHLLRATGPVSVAGGPQLTSANAADVLMRRVYENLGGDTARRNAYLVSAIGKVFEGLLRPEVSPVALQHSVMSSVKDGHLLAWSPHPGEQRFLGLVAMTGELPDPATDNLGLYVTNADASKLDYWLHSAVSVEPACGPGAGAVRLSLTNGAPAQVTRYVASKTGGEHPLPATTHRVIVSVFLPAGRGLQSISVDGAARPFSADAYHGWTVARLSLDIARGRTAQVTLALAGGGPRPPTVLTQPLVRPVVTRVVACGAG